MESTKLEIEHVYGYRIADCTQNLYVILYNALSL